MNEITQYTRSENFKYLVIEAAHGDYYGFNTLVKKEREIAMKIVSEDDDFMVIGWKVSKTLPVWVNNANSWIAFYNEEDVDYMEEENVEDSYKGVKVGRGKDDEVDDENIPRNVEALEHNKYDDEKEEKEDDEEEEEEEEEDDEKKQNDVGDDVQEDEFDEESEAEGDEEYEDEESVDGEDDEEEVIAQTLIKRADPLPLRGDEPWQGEPVVVDQHITPSKKGNDKKAPKKSNDKKETQTRGRDIFDNVDEDASIFASINGDDLKKEVAKNVKSSMKSNTVDIFITGPFRNAKKGKSTWITVFGDYGSAWTLKSQFIKGYITALLKRIKTSNINISHTDSFYDVNIRKYEYGKESLWRRNDQNKTTKRLSFVFTCDTANETIGKAGLIEAVQFFFKTMKKRDSNPIGPLVVAFLKEHAPSLYNYLLKKKPNEELVAENITDDIDKHFRAGFMTHWDDYLNRWLVDYDIIRILKDYVGYSSWTDVPLKQRGLCYKNYNQNATLPEWEIEQERY